MPPVQRTSTGTRAVSGVGVRNSSRAAESSWDSHHRGRHGDLFQVIDVDTRHPQRMRRRRPMTAASTVTVDAISTFNAGPLNAQIAAALPCRRPTRPAQLSTTTDSYRRHTCFRWVFEMPPVPATAVVHIPIHPCACWS